MQDSLTRMIIIRVGEKVQLVVQYQQGSNLLVRTVHNSRDL